jgi:hemolysin III
MHESSIDRVREFTATPVAARVKPRLRGVSHRYAFLAALPPCFWLVSSAPSGRETLACVIYCGSLLGLLGTSALYHGVTWSPRPRYWLARLDLLMIFVLIAGTYTPIAMIRLEPGLGSIVLTGMWGAALFGGGVTTFWAEPPKWATAAIFVSVASVAVLFLPAIVEAIGNAATALLALGGVLYVVGAIVYGLQRPDPHPAVFGYHELFHAVVVGAAAVHFATIAIYVVPGSRALG